jgi:hypothetical protein
MCFHFAPTRSHAVVPDLLAELTPRVWKDHFAAEPLHSDLERVAEREIPASYVGVAAAGREG